MIVSMHMADWEKFKNDVNELIAKCKSIEPLKCQLESVIKNEQITNAANKALIEKIKGLEDKLVVQQDKINDYYRKQLELEENQKVILNRNIEISDQRDGVLGDNTRLQDYNRDLEKQIEKLKKEITRLK